MGKTISNFNTCLPIIMEGKHLKLKFVEVGETTRWYLTDGSSIYNVMMNCECLGYTFVRSNNSEYEKFVFLGKDNESGDVHLIRLIFDL